MVDTSNVKSDTLKSAYANASVEERKALYANWAETYDEQTRNELGWMGFKPAAEAFALLVEDKSARILDAGCGTGLSGVALAEQGYTNIHGLDLSPEMLAEAVETDVYETLGEADLTKPLEDEEKFRAVFSCGVFGFGPPHPEHLSHLVKALEPGGVAVITVNGKAWVDTGWEEKLPKVVEEFGLDLQEVREIAYLEKEDIDGRLLIFRG